MTKLTLILTLNDPHDAKLDLNNPYEAQNKILRNVVRRWDLNLGLSNVENLNDGANALTLRPLLLLEICVFLHVIYE